MCVLFTDDFQDHGPMGDTRGHDAFTGTLEAFQAALPGFRHEIEDMVMVGEDTAIWHVHTIATFSGEMMGVRGQGQQGGKVEEHWGQGPEAAAA